MTIISQDIKYRPTKVDHDTFSGFLWNLEHQGMTRRFHSAIKINIFCEILIFTARCRVQPVAASDDRTGWREMRGGRGSNQGGAAQIMHGSSFAAKKSSLKFFRHN